jgi:hypothetical protein
MDLELEGTLSQLSKQRPIFHSERDLQHALAWEIQQRHPNARVRLEPRPRRGVHLDLLVGLGERRIAVELKYLVAGFDGTIGGESYDLPNQGAQDINRYDVVKDIVRVEAVLSSGYADRGMVVAVSNDGSYWRPNRRPDTVDAAFRIHDGRLLRGTLVWSPLAGKGTIRGRDLPLVLAGSYECRWRAYSRVPDNNNRMVEFRYLAIEVGMNGLVIPDGMTDTST